MRSILAPNVLSHPLRVWQKKCLGDVQVKNFDEGKPHLYIQAPTGSGKSRAMMEIILNFGNPGSHN